MKRRQKFWVYGAIGMVASLVLILLTAFGLGADPFHPRTRHIWALSLVAAAYVSLRGALIFEKLTSEERGSEGRSSLSALFRRKSHPIDERMQARRARVEAAKARKKEQEGSRDD